MQCSPLGDLGGFLVNMDRSQLPIRLLLFEQMVDENQDAMSQSHQRFLVSHALAQSLVIGAQKGVFAARGGVGSFNEGLTQPAISLARFGVLTPTYNGLILVFGEPLKTTDLPVMLL